MDDLKVGDVAMWDIYPVVVLDIRPDCVVIGEAGNSAGWIGTVTGDELTALDTP